MSFWMGITLPTQTILIIDRAWVNQSLPRVLPWFLKIKEKRKYLNLNEHVFFLPGGNVFGSDHLFEILKDHFGEEPFFIEDLTRFQSKFMEEAASIWNPVKGEAEKICKKSGCGIPGVDCLLGGLDRSGSPFLVETHDVNGFEFSIRDTRGGWFALSQGPVVDTMIEGGIQGFLGAAMALDEKKQREVAKDLLSDLFARVKERNRFVSSTFDMLFIGTDFEMSGSRYLWGR
jgi:hypothetical protein